MKKIILILSLTSAIISTSVAQTPGVVVSDKPGWHKIAERHVNYKTDRDEIVMVGNRHFKQIKIKVEDAPINLTSFEVYYSNDTKKEIAVNKMLNIGEETAVTDIDNTQALKKVVLVYNTVGTVTKDVTTKTTTNKAGEKETEKERERETEKERAEVEIWGLK